VGHVLELLPQNTLESRCVKNDINIRSKKVTPFVILSFFTPRQNKKKVLFLYETT
jgi:hypothetical protein